MGGERERSEREREAKGRMSGPAFWESLVKAGRAVYFPNIPLRLVAPGPEAAEKGLNVVTFITVPSTSKVCAFLFFLHVLGLLVGNEAETFFPRFSSLSPHTPFPSTSSPFRPLTSVDARENHAERLTFFGTFTDD